MILTTEAILRGVAESLRERVGPALSDKFAKEAVRLADLLLTMSANAVDDAVAIRVAENAGIRALFADAGSLVIDTSLAARIAAAARSADPGLKVGELDAESNRLRALLVELHVDVETTATEQADQYSQRIWRLLAELEAARAVA